MFEPTLHPVLSVKRLSGCKQKSEVNWSLKVLGIIRYVLAMLVLLSHSNGYKLGVNVGVVSVVIFYFFSGCLMRKSFDRFVVYSKMPVFEFYKDRLLKLFPQYILVVVATFLCFELMGPSQSVMFMNQSFDGDRFWLNLVLFPVNYVFEPLVIDALLPHPVIPPAWSLSAEFHFYLLLPFIVAMKRPIFSCLFVGILCVHVFSLFSASGFFNSENFGYRYIYGSLVFFLLGYCYAAREDGFYKTLLQGGLCTYLLVLVLIAPFTNILSNRFVLELLFGVMISLPLMHLGMSLEITSPTIAVVDRYLGRLSYPVFISHFLSFYLCEKLFDLVSAKQNSYYPVVILVCILISILLAGMQVLIDRVRINVRGFSSLEPVGVKTL